MSFFNKKEDVLHIELTPLGRHLLSLGKLKPHSYKFFDDDILYDSNSGGFSEAQNKTHERIIKNTPKLRHNGNINGIETNSNSSLLSNTFDGFYTGPEHKKLRKYYNKESHERYTEHIGTAKNDTERAPSLKVDLFNGEISSASKFLETDINPKHIPQINIDINYRVKILNFDEVEGIQQTTDYKSKYKSVENNGKVLVAEPEIPLIRIISEGDFDIKDAFDITCYKITNGSSGITYNQMKFVPDPQKIINDILVDEPQTPESLPPALNVLDNLDFKKQDSNYSEYYFTIERDREISDEDYCNTIGSLEVKNIYLDEPIRCPDQTQQNVSYNPYLSKISEIDEKDCNDG